MRTTQIQDAGAPRLAEQIDPIAIIAALDRKADRLLQWGYTRQAERLAHRAAELREGADAQY